MRSACRGAAAGAAEPRETTIIRTAREIATMSDTLTSVGTPLALPPLPTLDGPDLDLRTLRGKKVLLFMWGSW